MPLWGRLSLWMFSSHIPQDELRKLFALINSRLVSGGLLVFRVPNMASPLALVNYFGDLSHTTPLNEVSVQQLAFGSGLKITRVHPEPFAYPTSAAALIGILIWPLCRRIIGLTLAAFGTPRAC